MNAMANCNMRLAGATRGAAVLGGAMIPPLCARSYPNKPLRLVLPFPGAGGGADYVGRVVGQKLAVLSGERLASMPNAPTIKEAAGIEKSEVTTWYGLLAPAGTPRAIVERLNKDWNAAVAMPDTLKKMKTAGIETLAGTPEQFATLIKTDIARWAKVVKDSNISVE